MNMKESVMYERIQKLEKELKEANEANTRLRESNFYLQKEIDIVKSKLANQKYLDRQEVEKVLYKNYTIPIIETDEDGIHNTGFMELDIDKAVTTICNLAVKIDKDKIVGVLDDYGIEFDSQEVTSESVANEIISAIGGK